MIASRGAWSHVVPHKVGLPRAAVAGSAIPGATPRPCTSSALQRGPAERMPVALKCKLCSGVGRSAQSKGRMFLMGPSRGANIL